MTRSIVALSLATLIMCLNPGAAVAAVPSDLASADCDHSKMIMQNLEPLTRSPSPTETIDQAFQTSMAPMMHHVAALAEAAARASANTNTDENEDPVAASYLDRTRR
jgi:hypothetical protein